ncbi:MAG: UTP--glucose-1-phosphate uridylyltransferase GalU [Victivallaceae bacterium]|nr:UTP--glucose-1-phosphate uridylyltransferase GalU [Victivallaceae bacterium]
MKITKAVIPAAGFGTRFLPAAKAVPKEMIPLIDKPVIQYVVEEAVAAGITDILMVISGGKQTIQEHFSRNFELEQHLTVNGKDDLLADMRHITDLINIHYIYQHELNGLGDAIYQAKSFVGTVPFAILLGDTVTTSNCSTPVIGQLIKAHETCDSSVVALEAVPPEKVSRYGVIDGEVVGDDLYRVKHFVEKPSIDDAPSNLAIASRYIFTPELFEFLAQTPRGKGNEIQLTDAMVLMLEQHPMFGLKIDGQRHDIGNKLDFIKATISFALNRAEFKDQVKAYIGEKLRERS